MKLIKVKNGLLEAENFFLASSFSDFAGSANVVRDIKTGKLKLISNNKIERKFDYEEFVIELEKENFKTMSEDNYSMIYLGNNDYTFGIKDNKLNEQNKYWKILRKDGYIQAYSSNDGKEYKNIGGMKFTESINKQGFTKHCNEDFILNNYKVYANAYVTLQNAPKGSIVEFYNNKDELILTREFNADMECKVFLDNKIEGYFIFKDTTGKEFYKSDLFNLGYGDIYILSPYNFEIIYHGTVVTNTNPVLLQDLEEFISIKNISNKEYKNITIGTETTTNDLVQLSWNGEDYFDILTIDTIAPGEIKQLLVKIIKNADNHNFNVRDFQLVIRE
ncbi:hypothetical protein [Hathewaya massiliensis]|uniref:hypothetical protein n=1 Tax=Hathewaya massiliensis TaxID=1964382 RepID=UPI00115983B4|nr:hypothetical protein [Hathewaya massiliensis]